ncbi:hypothetical protein MACJ_004180 (apicoplast) [Theileria orientalis]|uniref:Uncharacterized protein n=1 Tax=Theileria orientalis TaxID=68886 RepID=A0A976SJZ2_THEOR|nr:hypothetical protein MACJ_004180 [Theileria orientalis]
MIIKAKENFKKFNNFNKFLKLKKIVNKIYINDDVIKKNYKYGNYIFGYCCLIKLLNFNILCIKFIILDKKNKEYAVLIKYYNLLNHILLFLN